MRQVRYNVATSLDGYIAGPAGEHDWIPMDPDINFGAIFARYDTVLMGRRTYETALRMGGPVPGMRPFVFSTTLKPVEHPAVSVVAEDAAARRRSRTWSRGLR